MRKRSDIYVRDAREDASQRNMSANRPWHAKSPSHHNEVTHLECVHPLAFLVKVVHQMHIACDGCLVSGMMVSPRHNRVWFVSGVPRVGWMGGAGRGRCFLLCLRCCGSVWSQTDRHWWIIQRTLFMVRRYYVVTSIFPSPSTLIPPLTTARGVCRRIGLWNRVATK